MPGDHDDLLKRIRSLCADVSKTIHNSKQQRKSALELPEEPEKLGEACENEQHEAERKRRRTP